MRSLPACLALFVCSSLTASMGCGGGSKTEATPREATPRKDEAPRPAATPSSDLDALLGWEREDVLGMALSDLRAKHESAWLEEYGVEQVTVQLPSGQSVQIWLSLDEVWPKDALERVYASAKDDMPSSVDLEARVQRVVAYDLRGDLDHALVEALEARLIELHGQPQSFEAGWGSVFLDAEHQRRIVLVNDLDPDLPVFVVERYLPLTSVFPGQRRVEFVGRSWDEVDKAQALVEFLSEQGWVCWFGYDGGEALTGGSCTLPMLEVTDAAIDFEITANSRRLRLVMRGHFSDTERTKADAAIVAAVTRSFGEGSSAQDEDGRERYDFGEGVRLTRTDAGTHSTWTFEYEQAVDTP